MISVPVHFEQQLESLSGGVADTVPLGLSPAENSVEALTKEVTGRPATLPVRLDDRDDVVERDLVDGHIAKTGKDVLVEGTAPVRFGLRATPPRLTGRNDLLEDGAQSGRRPARTRRPRVAAQARDAPILERTSTNVGERHKGVATETEIKALATNNKALNPRTCAGTTNVEIQTVTVTMAARTGLTHEAFRQPGSGVFLRAGIRALPAGGETPCPRLP